MTWQITILTDCFYSYMSQNVFNLVPRAIFPPFSYSEKMRWRRGWNILSSANFYCKTGLLLKHRKRVIWKSVFVWQNDTNIFYLLPKVWSTLHHGSVWPVHKKKCYLMLLCTFFGIFLFFIMKFIFIIFIFLEQVSNFRKRELVVSNCQWNCVHYKQQKTLKSSFILRKIVYFFTKILNYFALLIALVESELKLACWCTCPCMVSRNSYYEWIFSNQCTFLPISL